MKKVRNGVLCNTETAVKIGSWEHSSGGDFSYCYEALYRTRSGRFFLYGRGGPMTGYAQIQGPNTWGWGEKIKLLSLKEARQWGEEHLSGDEYIAAFGEPEEMYSVLVSEATALKFVELKQKTGLTNTQLIAEMIAQYER